MKNFTTGVAQAMTVEENEMENWLKVCSLEDIPRLGTRQVKHGEKNIALFRTDDDQVFALLDRCPHKNGPLSQGIVCGRHVTCPLHNWNIALEDGKAMAPDVGETSPYPVRIESGAVFVRL